MVADRDRQRIALDRIDRQIDADRARQLRAVAAQRHDIGVRLERLAIGAHRRHRIARRLDRGDRRAGVQLRAHRHAAFGQRAGELVRIAGLVGRAIDAAGDLLPALQRRLQFQHLRAIQHADLLPVIGEDLHMRDARLERRLVAMEIQHAARIAVVVERLGCDHLVQHALRVHRDPVLAQRVAPRLRRGAFGEELQRPGIQPRIGREAEPQRLVLAEQRLQQDPRRPRRGPDEGMPRRDHAGIAPARLARHARPGVRAARPRGRPSATDRRWSRRPRRRP